MEQPPEDGLSSQERQAKAIADLSCEVKLLSQRVEAGFAECSEANQHLEERITEVRTGLDARISELKSDFGERLGAIERRLDFYGRVFTSVFVALVAGIFGKAMQWW